MTNKVKGVEIDQFRKQLIALIHYCTSCEECRDEDIADHLIANGATIQKWIPVTERLPKEDEDVIAFCYYHESWQAQVCHLSSNYKEQWYTSVAGQWVKVTHWMPLPTPPKP